MDLFESTLKVVENRVLEQQNLRTFKQDLSDCEDYIYHLKTFLQEKQLISGQNANILKINNFIKNAFNDNSKESKILFSKIFHYVQEVEKNLRTVNKNATLLSDLYKENDERLGRMETKFINELKLLDIIKADYQGKALKENQENHENINKNDADIQKCEEEWNEVMNKYEEKQTMLNNIKMGIEILEDKIEEESELIEQKMQEKNYENQNILKEISSKIEKNYIVTDKEENILVLSNQLKEVLENNGKMQSESYQLKTDLECLERKCHDAQYQIDGIENRSTEMIKKIGEKELILEEKQAEYLLCKERLANRNNEAEKVKAKIAAVDAEIAVYENNLLLEREEEILKQNLDKLNDDYQTAITKSDEYIEKIMEIETAITKKPEELEYIKTNLNTEITNLKESIRLLTIDPTEKNEIETEIEEVEIQNKILQQKVEQQENNLSIKAEERIKLEIEQSNYQKELKNLTLQIDNIEKKKLKQKSIKLVPAPPLKRARYSTPQHKKRASFEMESDSSVDGEPISYAQFMAAKKKMKDKNSRISK